MMAPFIVTHLPFFPQLFYSLDEEPVGAQRNVWKLVAQRVIEHLINQAAIASHSSLSSFL